jgi:hypothetical protein
MVLKETKQETHILSFGDSDADPKFKIICEPNNWRKTVKSSEAGNTVSDLKLLQKEFWDALKEYANEHKTSNNFVRTPKPQHWYNISFGTSRWHVRQ